MHRIGKFLFYAAGIYGALWAFWAIRDLYMYWRLDAETVGKVQEANVRELSASSYDILATYTYIYEGESYKARGSLGKPYQLNQFAAEKTAENLVHASPPVYFNRRHPEISALKRAFPLKSVLQAGLTLGICLYLWVLNLYYAPSVLRPKKKL